MNDGAGDGLFSPQAGDWVEYNVSASLADPHQWQLGKLLGANADGTYDVCDEMMAFKISVGALYPPADKNVQQVNVGDEVMCSMPPSATGLARDMLFAGRVRVLYRDNGEDGTGDITDCKVNLVHRGVLQEQLRPPNLWASNARGLASIYFFAMLCVAFIAIGVVSDNQMRTVGQMGEAPRSAFAVITPTGCDPAVGRRLYGNDTNLWWGDGGWQFFQRLGICPVSGIVKVETWSPTAATSSIAIHYQGCLDFQNADLWQGMDALNQAAGVATNLAGAAR
jgi:hypothetical protein